MSITQWRREILSRLDDLEHRARQCRQYLEANDLTSLDHRSDFEDAWQRIKELFPENLSSSRAGDLERHLHFAMPHDFSDIEFHDIPAIRESVLRFGRRGRVFIEEQLNQLKLNSTVSDAMHQLIKDACVSFVREREYKQAALAAVGVVMDELRRLSSSQGDGDKLIRSVIGVQAGMLAFSDCDSDNSKSVTEGFKMIAQVLYKGVRNPASHGWDRFGKQEVVQVVITCSLLLGQLQFVDAED